MARKVRWGRYVPVALALAAVAAGYMYWIDEAKPHYAAVGDCVDSPDSGRLVHVSCSSAGALRVVAKFPGHDSNKCDTVAGTREVFVEYPDSTTSFVLCAANAASK
jgi:hypothetical protein